MDPTPTDIDHKICNETGPNGYHCTVLVRWNAEGKVPHNGPHVARAVVGSRLGSKIVQWPTGQSGTWNPNYRGR